jgi:hypothetical protein
MAGIRFSLGHEDAKVGDVVCVLLGAGAPFILRPLNRSWISAMDPLDCFASRKCPHLHCCIGDFYKVVGQAYVHDIMQYPGDIKKDIQAKKVVLQQYLLR